MSDASTTPGVSLLPDGTTVGYATLRVRDIQRQRWFYEDLLGFRYEGDESGGSFWAPDAALPSIVLQGDEHAKPRPPRTTGLYHIAFRTPTRPALGRWLRVLAQTRYPISGASDHIVSEAIYLDDPESNGIELYWDKPSVTWTWDRQSVKMGVLPLDLQVIYDQGEADDLPLPGGAGIGHMHLQTSNLVRAEEFYVGGLGFGVTMRAGTDALFLAAGKYHHHLGVNTWGTRGASPPPAGSLGLVGYSTVIPDSAAWGEAVGRLRQRGLEVENASMPAALGHGVRVLDPDGIAVVLIDGSSIRRPR